jgi:hypothetical protein
MLPGGYVIASNTPLGRDSLSLRERRKAVGDPGVPQQIALAAVMNKIAIVR